MPDRSSRLCRIAVHTETADADLTLPTDVPVAALIPAVLDLLAAGRGRPTDTGAPYRLRRLGESALDGSKTLGQHAIRDGTVLALTRTIAEPPAPRFDDPVERVSATVRATARPWTPRAAAAAAALAGTGLAGVAGFVAVPGGPGAPNLLLAAAAAATVAVGARQLPDCAGPALTAVGCLAVLAAGAALAVVLTGVSVRVVGALTATAALAALQLAARVSITVSGLAHPAPAGIEERAVRAHRLVTGLVVAGAAAAALGALGGATGGPGGVLFAAATGAALLLHARTHTERDRIAALLAGGIGALAVALVDAALIAPQHRPWLCVIGAALAAAALRLGFTAPAPSPPARRSLDLLEYSVLAGLAPLACWVCGWYGVVRGLNLT